MLILAKITGTAAGGYADYLEAKVTASQLGDYYLKDGERVEAPGRWAAGAKQFGLNPTQAVTAEQLHVLMDVRRPDTGLDLRRAGAGGNAVAAIDATFSAPKSVSAVWALAGPQLRAEIEQAHETAIDQALGYAIGQVPMLRRRVGADTVVHEKAKGLVATSWRHSTARAVEDQVPDPHLHSHVLLHAAVRQDGEIVAIDSRAWLVHQREVGAAYRSELARNLHQLGFEIQRGTGRGGRYFELPAVPQPLVDRWSSRHHQVQTAIQARLADQQRQLEGVVAGGGPAAFDAAAQLQALGESGLSPAQERMMGTVTRSAKLPVTATDLDTEWRRTAGRLGLSRERIDVLRHCPGPAPQPASEAELLDALTEFDATFPARDARAVALEQSAGAAIPDALAGLVALREENQILVLADGTGTTRAHRGKERTVVAVTERLTAGRVEPLSPALAETEVQRLDHELATAGGRLSDEQREAIMLACSDKPMVIIEGQAGTGKSTALTGIARAHQAAGREIIVTSTAGLAAERLSNDLHQAGVDCVAYSTQGLEAALRSGRIQLGPSSTVIHDEAALASTDEQLAVLDAIEKSGARLIAVGDPQQNQPVGAGGLWNDIETATRDAGAHAELTINQRARDPLDRRDQALFRNGHAEQAVRSYAARDHIHFTGEQRQAEDHALDAAHTDRNAGLRTIVIVQTSNEHLDQLNARAQAIRIQAGELGDEQLAVPGRPYDLHTGDEVQVRRTLKHPEQGALRNGTTAVISNVDPKEGTVTLRLGNDELVELDQKAIKDADLRLAYVQHPFPAQGQTTDTTHLVITDHTTQEGAYVGLTRARQRTDLYSGEPTALEPASDRLTALSGNMSRTEPEMASIAIPLAQEGRMLRAAQDERMPPRQAPAPMTRQDDRDGTERGLEPTKPASERHDAEAPKVTHALNGELEITAERIEENDRSVRPEGRDFSRTESDPERSPRRWPRSNEDGSTTHFTQPDRTPGYEP